MFTFYYSLIDEFPNVYHLTVNKHATITEVLAIINERHNKKLSCLYYEDSMIDDEEELFDYWEDSTNLIFIASTDFDYQPLKICKLFLKDEIKNELKNSGTKVFTFRFSGSYNDFLLKGIEVEMNMNMNYDECKTQLIHSISDKIDISDKKLIIYLSGGLPFITDTIGETYLNEKMGFQNVIYGVLINNNIEDSLLEETWDKINDEDRKILYSPLCNSSDRGLFSISCLIAYIYEYGDKTDLFLYSIASILYFPPLINSLRSLIDKNKLKGQNIAVICSTLYSYFRGILPSSYSDDSVFEYGLQLCNLISNINDLPNLIYYRGINISKDPNDNSLNNNDNNNFLLWNGDTNDSFVNDIHHFEPPSENDINNAFLKFSTFTPMAPLASLYFKSPVMIIKWENHEYISTTNKIFNPLNRNETINIEQILSTKSENQDIFDLIPSNIIKQIIMINFDASETMKNKSSIPYYSVAYQLLNSFVNKLFGFRIPSILGLVSFNDEIKYSYKLTPFINIFEKKCFQDILEFKSTPKLWDSLSFSCNEIYKFRKDIMKNEIYQNAISRIIVISTGEDNGSKIEISNLAKELIKNKIIVDSLIFNQNETDNDGNSLCALSHLTGGLSFILNDSTISFFEQRTFINIEERIKNHNPIKIDQITNLFLKQKFENIAYDSEIKNRELIQKSIQTKVLSLSEICTNLLKKPFYSSRQWRIMCEIKYINDNIKKFKSDVIIFPFKSMIDKWKLFIEFKIGEKHKRWFEIFTYFPDLYPMQPPNFIFISKLYHYNVSSDGFLCLGIEESYNPSDKVFYLIEQIINIFEKPNLNSPANYDACYAYNSNIKHYKKLQKESVRKYGKKNYQEFLTPNSTQNQIEKNDSFSEDSESEYSGYSSYDGGSGSYTASSDYDKSDSD